MAGHGDFVDFVAEQMAFVDGLRIRAMFGGCGIYLDDCMFALIADDRLYFKADGVTRSEFEVLGLRPFSYAARGRRVTLQYYEAPAEVFESQDAMRSWVRKAQETALKAAQGRRKA